MVDSIILVFKLTSLAVLVSLNHSPSCVLVFGAFPGYVTRCFTFMSSQFLPLRPTKVTIYATQCRHFLFLSFFFRCGKNLGICEATKDGSVASSKKREKKEHLKEPSNWDSCRTALWRDWPSNPPPKDADPELRQQMFQHFYTRNHRLCFRRHQEISWLAFQPCLRRQKGVSQNVIFSLQ